MENKKTYRSPDRAHYSLELKRYYLHLLEQQEAHQLNKSFASDAEEFLGNLVILTALEESLRERKAA
jgi:hypothetical protein